MYTHVYIYVYKYTYICYCGLVLDQAKFNKYILACIMTAHLSDKKKAFSIREK